MPDNQDRRNQKTVWDILPILAVVGSLITAWVNLNGELTQVKIQQSFNEKYNTVQYDSLMKKISDIDRAVNNITESNEEMLDQLTDLERTVTHMYSKKRN